MKKRMIVVTVALILLIALFSINRRLQTESLFKSIDAGDYDAATMAIDFGANVNGYKHVANIPALVMMNPTPLVQACKVGNEEIIKLLLECGANVNLPDKITGKTPLLAALHGTKQNRFSLAFQLIEQGADIHVVLDNNSPIAECLVFSEDDSASTQAEGFALLCYLLENGASLDGIPFSENALTYAAHYGNIDAIKYLLANEYFDVDEYDEGGCTALICAVKHHQAAVVEILLDYGASALVEDSTGLTAVDYAMQNKNQMIVDMLLRRTWAC